MSEKRTYHVVNDDYEPQGQPQSSQAAAVVRALALVLDGELPSALVVSLEGPWATDKPLSCHLRINALTELEGVA